MVSAEKKDQKAENEILDMETLFDQILEKLMTDENVRAAMGVWLLDTGCSDHITNMKLMDARGIAQ